jgi:hypothetical protein
LSAGSLRQAAVMPLKSLVPTTILGTEQQRVRRDCDSPLHIRLMGGEPCELELPTYYLKKSDVNVRVGTIWGGAQPRHKLLEARENGFWERATRARLVSYRLM